MTIDRWGRGSAIQRVFEQAREYGAKQAPQSPQDASQQPAATQDKAAPPQAPQAQDAAPERP